MGRFFLLAALLLVSFASAKAHSVQLTMCRCTSFEDMMGGGKMFCEPHTGSVCTRATEHNEEGRPVCGAGAMACKRSKSRTQALEKALGRSLSVEAGSEVAVGGVGACHCPASNMPSSGNQLCQRYVTSQSGKALSPGRRTWTCKAAGAGHSCDEENDFSPCMRPTAEEDLGFPNLENRVGRKRRAKKLAARKKNKSKKKKRQTKKSRKKAEQAIGAEKKKHSVELRQCRCTSFEDMMSGGKMFCEPDTGTVCRRATQHHSDGRPNCGAGAMACKRSKSRTQALERSLGRSLDVAVGTELSVGGVGTCHCPESNMPQNGGDKLCQHYVTAQSVTGKLNPDSRTWTCMPAGAGHSCQVDGFSPCMRPSAEETLAFPNLESRVGRKRRKKKQQKKKKKGRRKKAEAEATQEFEIGTEASGPTSTLFVGFVLFASGVMGYAYGKYKSPGAEKYAALGDEENIELPAYKTME